MDPREAASSLRFDFNAGITERQYPHGWVFFNPVLPLRELLPGREAPVFI